MPLLRADADFRRLRLGLPAVRVGVGPDDVQAEVTTKASAVTEQRPGHMPGHAVRHQRPGHLAATAPEPDGTDRVPELEHSPPPPAGRGRAG